MILCAVVINILVSSKQALRYWAAKLSSKDLLVDLSVETKWRNAGHIVIRKQFYSLRKLANTVSGIFKSNGSTEKTAQTLEYQKCICFINNFYAHSI